MLEFENLQQFTTGLDGWLEEVEILADDTLRGLAVNAFSYIVHGSPEWSGNLAASWRLSVGAPITDYAPSVYKQFSPSGILNEEPYSKLTPNRAAIAFAISLAKEEARNSRLGADIFITNNTPYALQVEENRGPKGTGFLRSVNLPVEMVHAAFDKFSGLGEISEARAAEMVRGAL